MDFSVVPSGGVGAGGGGEFLNRSKLNPGWFLDWCSLDWSKVKCEST